MHYIARAGPRREEAKGGLYDLTYIRQGRRSLYFYGESIRCDILCTIPGSHDEGRSYNQLV